MLFDYKQLIFDVIVYVLMYMLSSSSLNIDPNPVVRHCVCGVIVEGNFGISLSSESMVYGTTEIEITDGCGSFFNIWAK